MPEIKTLKNLSIDELRRNPSLRKYAFPKVHKSKFPTTARLASKPALIKSINDWHKKQGSGKPPKNSEVKMQLRYINGNDLSKLVKITKSKHPQIVAAQNGVDPKELSSIISSALIAFSYNQMLSEYNKELRKARDPLSRLKVKKLWSDHNTSFKEYYTKLGTKKFNSILFKRGAATLRRNKTYLLAVKTIAESASNIKEYSTLPAIEKLRSVEFIVDTAVIDGGNDEIVTQSNLCDNPIEASITKSFSRSFALNVNLYVPCPKWTNPFRWCWKTFTIAGASFSMGFNIHYKVDCLGFYASGSAFAEACGTIIGITVCAGCEGLVEVAAALGQVSDQGDCIFGAGARAVITCKLAGIPVYYSAINLGLVVHAPCIG